MTETFNLKDLKNIRLLEEENKNKYFVYIDGKKVEEYPTKLQALIYLILKGHCYYNYRHGCWIDNHAKIEELKQDD